MNRTPVYDPDPIVDPINEFLASEMDDAPEEIPNEVLGEPEEAALSPALSPDLQAYIQGGGTDIEGFYRSKFSQPNPTPAPVAPPAPQVDPIEEEAKGIMAQIKQLKSLQRQAIREGLSEEHLDQLDEQEALLNGRIAELKTRQIFQSQLQVAEIKRTLPQQFKTEVQQLVAARGFQGDVGDVYALLPDALKRDDVIASLNNHPEFRRFFTESLAWRVSTAKNGTKKAPPATTLQQVVQGQRQPKAPQGDEITIDFLMGRGKK